MENVDVASESSFDSDFAWDIDQQVPTCTVDTIALVVLLLLQVIFTPPEENQKPPDDVRLSYALTHASCWLCAVWYAQS